MDRLYEGCQSESRYRCVVDVWMASNPPMLNTIGTNSLRLRGWTKTTVHMNSCVTTSIELHFMEPPRRWCLSNRWNE
jgi:hypothetical protein